MVYRAAVVGCGRIGSLLAEDPLRQGEVLTHAEAYIRSHRTELVAVCDSDPACLRRCQERWRVAAGYADVAQMLREQSPDIVSICTPDGTHAPIFRILLQAEGLKAVWCEKPLATCVSDALEVSRMAAEKHLTVSINYTRRYATGIRKLRELVQAGSLGAVRGITGWYTKGVLHNGSHWFDLLRMLADEVESVSASNRLGDRSNDPTLDVVLRLQSGAVAVLRGADDSRFTVFEMDILLTQGRARLVNFANEVEIYRAAPSRNFSGFVELQRQRFDFPASRDLALVALEDLVTAMETGSQLLCTVDDGIAALRISAAAVESASGGGKEVRLVA